MFDTFLVVVVCAIVVIVALRIVMRHYFPPDT
jgi:hypothetical protein